MKFSSREDIEAPIEQVFHRLRDFEAFERSAMRRGADVQRVDELEEPGVGMNWDVSFLLRGRRRKVRLELVRFDEPNDMLFHAISPGIDGAFAIELLALSRNRTRMAVTLEVRPRNLSARLLVQSLKLAKTSLSKRYKLRVAEYARAMEERLKRSA